MSIPKEIPVGTRQDNNETMKEIRVYVIPADYEIEDHPASLTTDEFVRIAKKHGDSYNLVAFQIAWNGEHLSDQTFIRFVEIDIDVSSVNITSVNTESPQGKLFPIISISRQDIVDAGFDGESVDDQKMKDLASFILGFIFSEESFESAIHSFAEHYDNINSLEEV